MIGIFVYICICVEALFRFFWTRMKGNQLFFGCLFPLNFKIMDIFGRHIFGTDAEWFVNLCFEEQVAYIEKYTNQRDKEQIKQFLSNLKIGKDECLDCKQKRENYGRNISETVPTAVTVGNGQELSRGSDARDNTKRPAAKKAKNKRV